MPNYKPSIGGRFELTLTYLGILFTFIFTVAFLHEMVGVITSAPQDNAVRVLIEVTVYVAFVGFLVYGNVLYHWARIGYVRRRLLHQPATDAELREIYTRAAPRLTFLIPSYKEERRVIRHAILSTALQEYPNREVILLIDDPPHPKARAEQEALREARELPVAIHALLADVHAKYVAALGDFLIRKATGPLDLRAECQRLANYYQSVAEWFESQATLEPVQDHTDRLFVQTIFSARAQRYQTLSAEFCDWAAGTPPATDGQPEARLEREYRRLASLFGVTVRSFERKRYRNLSHEPNKAMNLNSYIALMGRRLHEVQRAEGLFLEDGKSEDAPAATIDAPDAVYLITLDADSLLLPEYALRLIDLLEKPAFSRVAVIQTPYSAIPNPGSELERIAGATTDIQYFIHQGTTYYHATFWVGANAVLRKAALEDIATTDATGKYPVRKFIQDRTLIEDTDSTVDLIRKGWTLFNYPERLSYSATPPDFGALLVQRGRWANGGILIVPRLLAYLAARPRSWRKCYETIFRYYYMVSLAGISAGYVVILGWPYITELNTWWLPLTALSYYLFYTRDLESAGYRKRDFLSVYALNLLLIPVHLMGSLNSLYQAITGHKAAFKRTPKISDRTPIPSQYILLEFGLLGWLVYGATMDFLHHHWMDGTFALLNAAFLLYAIWHFIGLGDCLSDLRVDGLSGPLARVPFLLKDKSQTLSSLLPESREGRLKCLVWLLALTLGSLPVACASDVKPAKSLNDDPLAISEPLKPFELAITVDDLPAHGDVPKGMSHLQIAEQIVAAFKANHVPAVYGFSNGEALDSQGLQVFKMWLKSGNPLGNHTLSHKNLAHSTPQEFIADIVAMDKVLSGLVPDTRAFKVFRYPFLSEGDTLEKRNQVRQYLESQGYQVAQVTVDYADWAWTDAYARCVAQHDERMVRWIREHVVEAARRQIRRSQKVARLVMGRDIKHILLLHVSALNAVTLPEVLKALEADGVRFIDLKTALRDPVYSINPNLPMPDGLTFLEQLVEMKDVDDPYDETTYTVEKLEGICRR